MDTKDLNSALAVLELKLWQLIRREFDEFEAESGIAIGDCQLNFINTGTYGDPFQRQLNDIDIKLNI